MTNDEFDAVKHKFEDALEELMDACDDNEYDIDDVLTVILECYDIEL